MACPQSQETGGQSSNPLRLSWLHVKGHATRISISELRSQVVVWWLGGRQSGGVEGGLGWETKSLGILPGFCPCVVAA